jgi:hypothetical protein
VIVRLLRFASTRLHDDLNRRARMQRDPMLGLASVDAYLDELRHRLLIDSCDAACESLPAALAEDVQDLARQLGAASGPAIVHAAAEARARAREARALASKPATAKREPLRAGLETLALACEAYGSWLDELAGLEPSGAPQQRWTDNPKPRAVADPVARLPAIVGTPALVRLFSVEERIDLNPGPAFVEIERHVARWENLRASLVDANKPATDEAAAIVDVDRCEAVLERLRQGLAAVPEIEVGPPVLDCRRYDELIGDEPRTGAQLLLELLDWGVIEPQRRALRAAELPEVALIGGQWSTQGHNHQRGVNREARR